MRPSTPPGRPHDAGRLPADLPALIPPRPGAVADLLDRDISRFLLDLSIALHHFAMYPPGHPALDAVLDNLARRTDTLLQDRPKIAVGVARDRLVIEGVVTAAEHALLRSLAERLHRHQLSALCLYRGVSPQELASLVVAIAEDPEHGSGPLGQRHERLAGEWPHVSLHPLTVGGLEMVSPDGADAGVTDRCAVLWVGLAQAALGREGTGGPPPPTEPAAVARAIDEHQHAEAYDQVIVGYLQQIAEEVRAARAPEALELRRRVSTLVSTMNPATLQRLLAMGGDAGQRLAFVRTASAGLTAGAVVDLVKAAAEATDEALSSALVRLLTKLAGYADGGSPRVQPLADSALRVQVARLVAGWNLPDPNPADYAGVLQRIAGGRSSRAGRGRAGGTDVHLRLVEICLELDIDGPALRRAIDALAEEGGLERAVAPVRAASAGGGAATGAWNAIVSAETVRRLLAHDPPDFLAVDAILPHLEGDALGPLFDLLLESGDRHARRAAFDRLRRTGRTGALAALARLTDGRWYALRNLLALLTEIDVIPPAVDPLPWIGHADVRVRREAFRLALRLDGVRERAVWAALADEDDRLRRMAVKAAAVRPMAFASPRLLDLARRETEDDQLRAGILEALILANRGDQTRDLLLEIASREARRLQWTPREAQSRASIVALAALATYWPLDPRVVPVLRRAAASRNAAIRQAATEARA